MYWRQGNLDTCVYCSQGNLDTQKYCRHGKILIDTLVILTFRCTIEMSIWWGRFCIIFSDPEKKISPGSGSVNGIYDMLDPDYTDDEQSIDKPYTFQLVTGARLPRWIWPSALAPTPPCQPAATARRHQLLVEIPTPAPEIPTPAVMQILSGEEKRSIQCQVQQWLKFYRYFETMKS